MRQMRMRTGEPSLSPREAAFVTGLSEKTINQAIDRDEVQLVANPRSGRRDRRLAFPDLVYLRLRERVGRLLSPEGRRQFRQRLAQSARSHQEIGMVRMGMLNVDVTPEVRALRGKLEEVEQVRAYVVSDPEVRAGEPVVRGTRISVYVLADLAAQGAPVDELLEDYPALTREGLEAAFAYARMYPRRGRPRRAPWKNGIVIREGA